jgi:hypothetical protein
MYECRCDKRLKAKAEGSTRLAYTGFRGGLEHLKIGSRLIECENVTSQVSRLHFVVCYKSRKRELKIRLMNEGCV